MPSVSGSFWIQSLPLGIASEQTTLPYGRHVRCPCRSNYHNARFVRLDGGDDDDVDHHNANERTSERACGERWHFMSPCAHTHSHTRLTRLPITYHSCVLRWHTPPSHPVPGLCMLAEVPLRMVIYVILFLFSLSLLCNRCVHTLPQTTPNHNVQPAARWHTSTGTRFAVCNFTIYQHFIKLNRTVSEPSGVFFPFCHLP